ncbi:spore germination protein D [Salsuginibacillus halophilus]|uniref:Spore germination protein D n=2 Tax=Salsuginibacillus halophilus TaxID=517424 RepID=A0A2P8H8W5_9BACI|nr:spore germination protein D [Salsuginibacillus halophilus]
MLRRLLPMFLLLCLLFGCAAQEQQSAERYEQTKGMMQDLLKSDESKEALLDILDDDEFRERLVLENAFVETTIKETLASADGEDYWVKLMREPAFAKAMAESMHDEHEAMAKDLIKDPEYRDMLMEVMKDPEIQEETFDLLRSSAYREEVMKIMMESFDAPKFRAEVQGMLADMNAEIQEQALETTDEDEKSDEENSGEDEDEDEEEEEVIEGTS